MKKTRLLIFLATLAFLLALACPAFCGKPLCTYQWKVATVAPEGLGWSKRMYEVVFPVIHKATSGDLGIKVHWGGSLGEEETYYKKIKDGEIQGAGFTSLGSVALCPEMAVLQLPFLFNNYQEVDYLRVKLDSYFNRIFREKGLYLVGWLDQDFDQVFSTKDPMGTLADFERSRFLAWNGVLEETMLRDLGAKVVPTTISNFTRDVREGKGNAAIAPAVGVVGLQTHTLFRYVNPVKIRYSPATLLFSIGAMEELPEKYLRDFFLARTTIGWKYANLARADNERYLQALVDYGMKRTVMSPEQLKALKASTRKVWGQVSGKLYPPELLKRVEKLLGEYRSGKRLVMEDIIDFSRPDDKPLDPETIRQLKESLKKNMHEFNSGPEPLLIVD